jgi:hypothetical protein
MPLRAAAGIELRFAGNNRSSATIIQPYAQKRPLTADNNRSTQQEK